MSLQHLPYKRALHCEERVAYPIVQIVDQLKRPLAYGTVLD